MKYDYIHYKTIHCSCSVVEGVSTNFSDNTRSNVCDSVKALEIILHETG